MKPLFQAAGLTDIGRVRNNNEDSFFFDGNKGIFIVADGMGGHNSGEVASSLAVSLVKDFLIQKCSDDEYRVSAADLEAAVKAANRLVYEKGRLMSKDAGMGTTLVCACGDGKTLTIAHVGDSRGYILRQGVLSCLTEDHSVVREQIRRGLLREEEAATSELQNLLTRAVGSNPDVEVDVSTHPLFYRDIILLASDGLTKMVADFRIQEILSRQEDVKNMAANLVSEANGAGGIDNITVVVARVEQGGEKSALGASWSKMKSILKGKNAKASS